MLDFYNKIKQVLSLEKDKGFQNSAVSGGLGKFIGFIEKQGEQNNIHRDIITPLINYFESYATLSYKDREKSIDIILDCLSEIISLMLFSECKILQSTPISVQLGVLVIRTTSVLKN
jgi:hypothetical protein